MPRSRSPRLVAALATLALVGLAAPGSAQSEPAKPDGDSKSKPTTQSRPASQPAPAGPTDVGAFILHPPKEWKTTPVPAGLRKAHFLLPRVEGDPDDGELIVYYFGKGGAGSADANLARWSQQVSKEPGMSDEEHSKRSNEKVSGLDVTHLELHGTYTPASFGGPQQPPQPKSSMFAAVVETPHGNYYIRATGPRKTMLHWKKEYRKMISGLKVKKGVGEI